MTQTSYPKIVLAVGAHPDDIDFIAGGTVAEWIADGAEVHYLIATGGEAGSPDPNLEKEDIIATRAKEQQAAADLLGVKSVNYLERRDGSLKVEDKLEADIVYYIRKLQPEAILTMSPTLVMEDGFAHINHRDHRAIAECTFNAAYPSAGNPRLYKGLEDAGLKPHSPKEIYFCSPANPNFVMDISKHMEIKIEALTKHTSQYGDGAKVTDMVTKEAERVGKTVQIDFGEPFTKMQL